MREMTLACERILMSMAATQIKYSKAYCYPSVKTLQKNLQTNWGVRKSIRQIYRSLAWLEAKECLKRKRRVRWLSSGQWRQQSTLYILLGKAYEFLKRVGRWVKGYFDRFRMTFPSFHQSLKTEISTRYSEKTSFKEERPPPDTLGESFRKGFEGFKAFCQSL